MFTFKEIFIVLAIHTIFDFLLQTRKMAENKSLCFSRTDCCGEKALFSHILIYTLGLILMATCIEMQRFFYFVLVNALYHFLTDLITSKISTHFFKHNQLGYFWNVIGIDQLIHFATLFAILSFAK